MKSLCRLSLAALIFAATAAGVHAQDPNAEPPPVVTAVPETPADQPAPSEQPAPAEQAAPTEQPAAAPENPPPALEPPAAPPALAPPAAAPVEPSVVEPSVKEKVTTQKKTRVTQSKEKVKPQEPAPVVEQPQPADPAAAAAGTAATGSVNPPPPEGPAPPPAVENPAPPPPPLEAGDIVQQKEAVETETKQGTSGWVVVGIVALAGVGIYLLMSRRRKEESLSIYDRDLPSERLVMERTLSGSVRTQPRTGPPITHQS